MNTQDIIKKNIDTLTTFFIESVDGTMKRHNLEFQLYLDLRDGEIFDHYEINSNSWLQRNDGSLVKIESICCYYDDRPTEEYYCEGCDLRDYGYEGWLEQIEDYINTALEKAQ